MDHLERIQKELDWVIREIKCLKKCCEGDSPDPTPEPINQNNFVRVLEINEEDLSGEETIEKQICEYILGLPEEERTIAETDSKWNIVVNLIPKTEGEEPNHEEPEDPK